MGTRTNSKNVTKQTLDTSNANSTQSKQKSNSGSSKNVGNTPGKNNKGNVNSSSAQSINQNKPKTAVAYTVSTGFSQDAPEIVLSSEFLPIDGTTTSSDRDYALNTKEKAILLTAQNAIKILQTKPETKELIDASKSEILKYVDDQSSRSAKLLNAISEAALALDIKNYQFLRTRSGDEKLLNFQNALRDSGLGDLTKYLSPTALYQQYVLELKRSLLTHTTEIVKNPILIQKQLTSKEASYSLRGNFAVNENGSIVPLNGIPKNPDSEFYALFKRGFLTKNPYENLSSQVSAKKIIPAVLIGMGNFDIVPVRYSITKSNNAKSYTAIQDLDEQMQILATELNKEFLISKALKHPVVVSDLANIFGYAVSTAEGTNNYRLWDFLIGDKFSTNVLSLDDAEASSFTGLTEQNRAQSILALSRGRFPTGPAELYATEFRPLTFELDDISEVDDAQEGLTHGSLYYIDSSLSVTEQSRRKFDTSRLDQLILKLKSAKTSIKNVRRIAAGVTQSDPGTETLYEKVFKNNDDDLVEKAVKLIDENLIDVYRQFYYIANTGYGGSQAPRIQLQNFGKVRNDALGQWERENLEQPVPYAAGNIVPAVIIKYAYEKAVLTNKPEDSSALKALFLIIAREMYKKLSNDITSNLEISYDPFVSNFETSIYKVRTIETDYVFLTETNETAKGTEATTTSGESLGTFWNESAKWAQTLISPSAGNANSPDLFLEGILLRDKGKFDINEKPKNTDTIFIPMAAAANLGQEYSSNSIEINAVARFIAGVLSAGALADETGSSFSDFELGTDKINVGDDPVFRALFLTGNPFIQRYSGLSSAKSEKDSLISAIAGLMAQAFKAPIYRSSEISVGADTSTTYSGHPKVSFLWNYFLLICHLVSKATPEKFNGFATVNGAKVKLGGYSLASSPGDKQEIEKYFGISTTFDAVEDILINTKESSKFIYSKPLQKFIQAYKSEISNNSDQIQLLENYINDTYQKVVDFKSTLNDNFTPYLDEINRVVDTEPSLTETQKTSFVNLSLAQEQIILSEHAMSELSDRLSTSNFSETSLRAYPEFATYPKDFINYFPLNDVETISYKITSGLALDNQFANYAGNNKRILSVGLPPRLARNILGAPGKNAGGFYTEILKSNIIKISVYKNDVLNPGIVFRPKTFLFEVNRFPTRIVSNWQLNSDNAKLSYEQFSSKFFNPFTGKFLLHRNIIEAFEDYGNLLTSEIKQEIYRNHAYSFFLEQYIKWFTNSGPEELRFYRYNSFFDNKFTSTSQFNRYLSTTQNKFDLSNIYGDTIPTGLENPEKLVSDAQNSVKSYLKKEMLLTSVDELKKRIFMPKKFDRVFNLIVDPDDFEIENVHNDYVNKYENIGLIRKNSNSSTYVYNRITQQTDVYMDEFWVDIESYFKEESPTTFSTNEDFVPVLEANTDLAPVPAQTVNSVSYDITPTVANISYQDSVKSKSSQGSSQNRQSNQLVGIAIPGLGTFNTGRKKK